MAAFLIEVPASYKGRSPKACVTGAPHGMQTISYLTGCDHKSYCYKPSYPTVTTVPDGITEAKHNQVLWTSMQKHCERRSFVFCFPPRVGKIIINHRCFEFLVWNMVDRTCRRKVIIQTKYYSK